MIDKKLGYDKKTQKLIDRMCKYVERKDYVLNKKIAEEKILKTYDLFNLPRPKKIAIVRIDELNRFHSTREPAIRWKEGKEFYYLHGINFKKEWWDKIVNDKMSPKEIFAIDNLEHRRIAYEYMDKTKMKSLKDYKVLDEVVDNYKNPMKVISFTVKNINEPLKYLNVFCPTTKREYFIGTNEETCNSAKAKSFGFNEEELEFISEY